MLKPRVIVLIGIVLAAVAFFLPVLTSPSGQVTGGMNVLAVIPVLVLLLLKPAWRGYVWAALTVIAAGFLAWWYTSGNGVQEALTPAVGLYLTALGLIVMLAGCVWQIAAPKTAK